MSSGAGSSGSSGLQFSLAGFPVSVPLNTLLGVALIAWLWLPSFSDDSSARQWASAVVFAVALLASVLLHEFAHAVAARRFGFPVIGITLWAFGGYTSYRPVRDTPGRSAVIAASGPLATLLLAIAAWIAFQQVPDPSSMVGEVLAAAALANALVAVFNMLPGLPLDGGAVLGAGVWKLTGSRIKGQRVAAYAGMTLAALIVAVPLALSRRSGEVDFSLMLVSVLLAAFLFVGARGALQSADRHARFDGRTAIDLAVPAVVVPEHVTVAELDDYLVRNPPPEGLVALVGDASNGLRGYVLPPALAAVPAAARPATPIGAVTRNVARWGWLQASANALDAMEAIEDSDVPIVLTDGRNRPVGVILAQPRLP